MVRLLMKSWVRNEPDFLLYWHNLWQGKKSYYLLSTRSFLFWKLFVCSEKGSSSETIYWAIGTRQALGCICVISVNPPSPNTDLGSIPNLHRSLRPKEWSIFAWAYWADKRGENWNLNLSVTVFKALPLKYAVKLLFFLICHTFRRKAAPWFLGGCTQKPRKKKAETNNNTNSE